MNTHDLMGRVEITRGDITQQVVDAIVNAANESLLGGGGVDGAIHRAAGPELLAECKSIGGCPTGQARITRGYRLKARYVIHTVGPVWRGGDHGERDLLASCYQCTLHLARDHDCAVVAYPAISCGAYGYPLAEAASTSLSTVLGDLARFEMPRRVRWVMFDHSAYDAWREALASAQESQTGRPPTHG